MNNLPLIIDDFIPKSQQELIKNTLLGNTFQWHYTEDITYGATAKLKRPAFFHQFIQNGSPLSPFYNLVASIALLGAEKANFNVVSVERGRTFLQIPLNTKLQTDIDPLHIDIPLEHLVVLYYVLDSDGDTIIVDKTLKAPLQEEYNCEAKDYKILHKVTPKQGRCIIFDGRYYHTAEQPKDNIRCIINFDLMGTCK